MKIYNISIFRLYENDKYNTLSTNGIKHGYYMDSIKVITYINVPDEVNNLLQSKDLHIRIMGKEILYSYLSDEDIKKLSSFLIFDAYDYSDQYILVINLIQ